ncbi:MAG: nucleotidyltransferase family protein [Chthoniobacterales bacterium]
MSTPGSGLELMVKRNNILPVSESSNRTIVTDSTGIGAVILAAGPSRRMGKPKQSLEFGGQSLLRRAASSALESGCRPVVVVTGANAPASRESLHGLDLHEVENRQWESGLGSSVRVGIEAVVRLNLQITAVVLMVCDQPFVTREIITGLVTAYREAGCSIVASRYGGSYGVPALFSSSHFGELGTLESSAGARQIIQKHLATVQFLPFPEGEIDVDTPDDFARLQSMSYPGALKERAGLS